MEVLDETDPGSILDGDTLTVGADNYGTPVFVHFSAQAASNSNISEAIM